MRGAVFRTAGVVLGNLGEGAGAWLSLSRHVDGQFEGKFGPRALTFIGRQEWLDRPSYRFEHVLSVAYNALGSARDRVTNALSGVWLGHPAHPPLASLTTGAIGTTVALDALSLLPGRPRSELLDASRFASRALGLGILANLGSAATGVTDWQHTHEEDRRIGLVHGVLNAIATGLYGLSWWHRRRGKRTSRDRHQCARLCHYRQRQLSGWCTGVRVRYRN